MTPKEKALEIHSRMFSAKGKDGFYTMTHETAKNCALIAVDKIEHLLSEFNPDDMKVKWQKLYYSDVKKEIQKL